MYSLNNIGFLEITDQRASLINSGEIHYLEFAVTAQCNFNCTYCNPLKTKDLSLDEIKSLFIKLKERNLQFVQLTGGEPLMRDDLLEIVKYAKSLGIRCGLSTNGSKHISKYMELVDAGVELFSISLDDFDDKNLYALGYNSQVTQIVNNIRDLSKLVYVNIGTVINSSNILRAEQIIKFILNLGVNDIKISIATNYGTSIPSLKDCYKDYPILNYRVEKFKQMETMRGLCTNDASQCFLVKNDISVCGDKHYSCLVYAREGGEAIGSIHDADWYEQRVSWFESRDIQKDPICKKYCMDFKVAFNNKCAKSKNII